MAKKDETVATETPKPAAEKKPRFTIRHKGGRVRPQFTDDPIRAKMFKDQDEYEVLDARNENKPYDETDHSKKA